MKRPILMQPTIQLRLQNIKSHNIKNSHLNYPLFILACFITLLSLPVCHAHHVLGRPAYSLNEDSNTPPSMQVETQIGKYFVTYMVFPAFPKPKEPGRVNLYAARIDNGETYNGIIQFKAKNDTWFRDSQYEILGTQPQDDGVYRQRFLFQNKGDYIITATFEADGEPYTIDFPLRIGAPKPIGPIGIAIAIILIVLVFVNMIQRKKLIRAKIKSAHQETSP